MGGTVHHMIRSRTQFALLLAIVSIFGALFFVQQDKKILNARSTDHVRGSSISGVHLIEYSDYTCIFCAATRPVIERLIEEEDVQVSYRHSYNPTNTEGIRRAIFAECVAQTAGEKAFATYTQFLYENQHRNLDDKELTTEAVIRGSNTLAFNRCRDDDGVRKNISRDSAEAKKLGALGTPFIAVIQNGIPLGALYANEYGVFIGQLRELLAKKKQ